MSDNDYTKADNGDAAAVSSRKMYYSISEVCSLTGLEDHVLRHWEKEFSKLRPKKNSAGKRAYRDKDIEMIRRIKLLLREEKCSINEAKAKLAEERKAETPASVSKQVKPEAYVEEEALQMEFDIPVAEPAPSIAPGLLSNVRRDLQDVLALLES